MQGTRTCPHYFLEERLVPVTFFKRNNHSPLIFTENVGPRLAFRIDGTDLEIEQQSGKV